MRIIEHYNKEICFRLFCLLFFFIYFVYLSMLVNTNDGMYFFSLILFFFFFLFKEFCQTEDCRSGDCELLRLSNELIQKNCHCPKVN